MALVLEILFGVAILASFFVAYMSAKTWPIYQAVLVAFLFLGSVAFFYLGARTLATHRYWRNQVKAREAELLGLEGQMLALRGGLDPQGHAVAGTLPQVKHELALVTTARGGVYYDAVADSFKNNVLQLTLKAPEHGLAPGTVLFAFDQKGLDKGGRFLGEFNVVATPEKTATVQLSPTLALNEAQTKRVEEVVKEGQQKAPPKPAAPPAAAPPAEGEAPPEGEVPVEGEAAQPKPVETVVSGGVTLYTTMPVDNAAVFARLDDAARAALLPPGVAAEYAKADRPLRDYTLFIHDNYVQKAILNDTIGKLTRNIQKTEAATKETIAEGTYRDTEKANLTADLEKFKLEVAAIANYQGTLEKFLSETRTALKTVYVETRQSATRWTEEQLKAAEEINRRSTAISAPASTGSAPAPASPGS